MCKYVALWRKERSKGYPCSIQKIEMQGQQIGLICFGELFIPLVIAVSAFLNKCSLALQCSSVPLSLVPAPVVIVLLGNMSLIH